jgi:hypothetical protein
LAAATCSLENWKFRALAISCIASSVLSSTGVLSVIALEYLFQNLILD